ncbi:MAG: 50S ribosomal protein L21 [Candidatus Levyibacteriota bacterium]
MKYAVVVSGGKQYKVVEGQELLLDHLDVKKDDAYTFPTVLLFVDEGKAKLGKPTLSDVVVKGMVLGEEKGEKIRVAKFKSKVRYRRVTGHRSLLTRIKITAIEGKGKTTVSKTTKETEKKEK